MVMAHWYYSLHGCRNGCPNAFPFLMIRAQAIRNKKFCKYDYGVKKNVEIYGQEEPPSYDLGSIDNAKVSRTSS